MKTATLYKRSAAAIIAIVAVRFIGFLMPSSLTWGIDYFAYLPFQFVVVYAAIGVITALWLIQAAGQEKPALHIEENFLSSAFILPAVGVLFIAAAMGFQIQLPLLGDSFVTVQNYTNTFKGIHTLHLGNEPASNLFFWQLLRLIGEERYPGMLTGFLFGEIVLGGLFLALAFLAAGALQTERRNRNLVFIAMLSLPVLQIFFGYLEIYAVPAVAVLAYCVAALYFLNRRLRVEIVSVVLLAALFTHFLLIVFLPSLYYCLWRSVRRNPAADGEGTSVPEISQSSQGSQGTLVLAIIQGAIVTAVAIAVFVSRESSGSHILSPFRALTDPFQAYSLFSPYHFSELVNMLFLYAPLIVLPAFIAVSAVRKQGIKRFIDDEKHAFLALTVCGYGAFLLVAKFDLGFAGDWDVSAPHGAPAMLLISSLFLASGKSATERLAMRRILAAIIVMGFAQTIPWFYLNSTIDPNLARCERFLDTRTVSPDGNYQGHYHLSFAYGTLGRNELAADVWKKFMADYPSDWRGFQNYAHKAALVGRTEDPLTEQAYERAFALDSAHHMQREYSQFYADRAKATFEHGNPDSTIWLLQRAIAIDSSNAGAWFNLASVYDAIGDVKSATSTYFDLLDRAPRFIPGYEGLVKNLLKLGSPEAAIEMGEKALTINTNSAVIYQSLAEAYRKLNRTADADRAQQRATALGAK